MNEHPFMDRPCSNSADYSTVGSEYNRMNRTADSPPEESDLDEDAVAEHEEMCGARSSRMRARQPKVGHATLANSHGRGWFCAAREALPSSIDPLENSLHYVRHRGLPRHHHTRVHRVRLPVVSFHRSFVLIPPSVFHCSSEARTLSYATPHPDCRCPPSFFPSPHVFFTIYPLPTTPLDLHVSPT
jgi:hypothetical protein